MTAFFAGLGFEAEGRTVLEGEFLDTIGIPDSRTEIVMLRPPGGGTGLELPSSRLLELSEMSVTFSESRRVRD